MTNPLWVTETADGFWDAAGGPEPFPRSLRIPIANALPLTVVLLPKLRVNAVDDWLRRRGIRCAVSAGDRALRACLVARSGQGFSFVEGADPEDEQRFSLAHELAHFLRDYWQPRRRVLARLGPTSREVLDGERPPTREERIDSILSQTPLGHYVHLMDRAQNGALASPAIDWAERDANLLAFELLAPADLVLNQRRTAGMERRLIEEFGLPPSQAARYASELLPEPAPSDSLRYRLGLPPTS